MNTQHRRFTLVRLGLVTVLAIPQLSLLAVPLGVVRADAPPAAQPAVREIEIVVKQGYQPGRIEVKQGERVRLKFVRKEYNNCTREVVFPKLDIRRELPTNKPVLIDLPELQPGEYEFHCGMKMVKGLLVVTAR